MDVGPGFAEYFERDSRGRRNDVREPSILATIPRPLTFSYPLFLDLSSPLSPFHRVTLPLCYSFFTSLSIFLSPFCFYFTPRFLRQPPVSLPSFPRAPLPPRVCPSFSRASGPFLSLSPQVEDRREHICQLPAVPLSSRCSNVPLPLDISISLRPPLAGHAGALLSFFHPFAIPLRPNGCTRARSRCNPLCRERSSASY